MTTQEIAETLNLKPKGSFFTIVVDRPAKTRKDVTDDIRKISTMQGRLAGYDRMKDVREAVEDGARDEVEKPSYVEREFVVGSHATFWQGNTGAVYLPMPISGNKSKSIWTLNGKQVKIEEIQHLLLSKELRPLADRTDLAEKGQVPFVAVNIENISEVH